MHANIQYINLSWVVVGVCESRAMPLWKIILLPRFYLVMLRQQIAPMESDGLSRVYQM